MKKTLILLLLLAACNRGGSPADNRSAPESRGAAAAGSGSSPSPQAAQARLAGLYEGGSGDQKNQMCIVEKGAGAQFGMLVWGGSLSSCSGAGKAVREGERLALTMTGDETCTIEATLKDGIVTLPDKLPLGCAYYCGAHASFAGARFTRVGGDVKKATDIAGDPLCD